MGNKEEKKILGAILLGGQSTRMKYNKAFLKININNQKITFLQEIINRLSLFADKIVLNFNKQTFNLYEIQYKSLKDKLLIADDFFIEVFDLEVDLNLRGPLLGLYTISKELSVYYRNYIILLVAVDQVLINPDLIKLALKYIDYDFIFFEFDDFVHFLPGFYKINCFELIEKYIIDTQKNSQNKKYSLKNFVNYLMYNIKSIKLIDEEEIKKVDKNGLTFYKIDTPKDYYNIIQFLRNN